MTKKKRSHPSVEEVLERPWCFYCERDFDDLKILLNHQKAKHFKCDHCGRRLNTAGGLSVHLSQVHKENLETIENALPDRSIPNIEIFGMEGIPDEVIQRHNQRVITEYHENQESRRAATGNPPPGTAEGNPSKRPKIEDSSDMKARLAAFKAKKAAGEVAGQTSGNDTPTGAGQAVKSEDVSNSPAPFPQVGAPGYAPPPFSAQGSPPSHFSQPYNQAGYNMPMQQQPPFPPPQSHSPFPAGPPGFQQPPPIVGFGQQFPPVGRPPFPLPPMASPPPGGFSGQSAGSPGQNGMPNRPPGSPLPLGLPTRPSFQAPSVNASQLQQMHQGQFSPQEAPTQDPRQRPKPTPTSTEPVKANGEDLVASALKASDTPAPEPVNGKQEPNDAPKEIAAPKPVPEKKSKKDKEKAITLVYDDNEVSPEEKMAAMSRYAFERPKLADDDVVMESASGPAGATVTGVVASEDDVLDTQGD